jgi:RNA polymerase sigma-70 factor (ECF subfamily)
LNSEPTTLRGTSHTPAREFTTTRWTQVLEARGDSPQAKAALSELSARYYAPVLAFIQRTVRDEDHARDLTHEFFSRLLGRCGIDAVNPERGRFRSFLLGAVKHFLADMRDHDRRIKRGAGQCIESLESGGESDTSPGVQLPDPRSPSPDREFDRKWAHTVLEYGLHALAEEHKAAGKSAHFNILKPWLTGEPEGLSQAEAARELGISESAAAVAVHRLRKRFREVVKAEIARTLHDPAQVSDELACLVDSLTSK